MSTLISAKPEALRTQSTNMTTSATEVEGEFASVEGELDEIAAAFKGEAAEAFDERVTNWKESADGLVEALKGLGAFLDAAANAFESVDDGLASGLKGGGGEPTDEVGARVSDLREIESRLRSITSTLDGDAKALLSKLGLTQAEMGGPRTYDEIGGFQRGWSHSRKRIVDSADSAAVFIKTTADAFESLNAELQKAMSGE